MTKVACRKTGKSTTHGTSAGTWSLPELSLISPLRLPGQIDLRREPSDLT